MKITVGTTSATLAALCGTALQEAMKNAVNTFTITNNGANAIYVETYGVATEAGSTAIASSGGKVTIEGVEPGNIHLITGTEVTDVRILPEKR